MLPAILTVPSTLSLCAGAVLPIPTSPFELILSLSIPADPATSLPDIVPNAIPVPFSNETPSNIDAIQAVSPE